MLDTPSEQDLSGGLAVLGGDSLDFGAVESLTLSHGRVSLDVDTALDASLTELLVSEEGVRLNLVDGGLDAAVGKKMVELLDVKVGDTDRLDLAGVDGVLKSLPGLETLLGTHGTGGVHEVHVHVFDVELLERVLNGSGGLVVVSIPELGGDKDVGAGDVVVLCPLGKGTADRLLVHVTSGCKEKSK